VECRPITKFIEYMEMFARFKQTENLHALSNVLDSHPEFAPVERAQLGESCPTPPRTVTSPRISRLFLS
jgi:DNA-directed RNA polymerase II subunit RPB4